MNILYSMCWEDYNLPNKYLKIKRNDSVLCIASGGENLFSLALNNPKRIIGIDNNVQQIYLVNLKKAAILSLKFEEFIKFIGFSECNNRLELFKKCFHLLDYETKEFWLKNIKYIKKGVINAGRLERYIMLFRKYLLPLCLSKENIKEYLSCKTLNEQRKIYYKNWNNKIWRMLFRIFFSKLIMQFIGRKKEFFRHNINMNIGDSYLKRAEYGITSIPVKDNPFIEYILTGRIKSEIKGHPYLDKNKFLKLKKSIENIELIKADFFSFIKEMKTNSYKKYALSDIFEIVSQEKYEESLKVIAEKSRKDSIICYWNNLVKRNFHPKTSNFKRLKNSSIIKEKDRVFFYSDFIVEKLIH